MALGASAGATLLAGCSQSADLNDPDGSNGGGATFRLLISDMPADIGDFERLDVSFDSARIFDGGSESNDSDDEESEDVSGEDDERTDDSTDDEGTDDSTDDEGTDDESVETDDGGTDDESVETDDGVERRRGFYVLDLDDATVDLTQVVGDRAIPIFEGELSEGTYNKIELHVSEIEGIVDGEQVDVKVPSEKLQITTPFELSSDATTAFVFDINVVKRGPENRYNLTPVISESGIVGEDVEVEEVDGDSEVDIDDEDGEEADDGTEEEEESEGTEGEGTEEGEEDRGENGGAANAGDERADGKGNEEAADGDGDDDDDPSEGDGDG